MLRSIELLPKSAALAAILLATTGCSVFRPTPDASEYTQVGEPTRLASLSEEAYYKVREARQTNSIVLEIDGSSEPIRVLPLPPEGQSVFLSTLLRQTRVAKKVGPLDVELMRATNTSLNGLGMSVKMNSGRDNVRPETDYALQPGDRIRVKKYKPDALNSLLEFAGI